MDKVGHTTLERMSQAKYYNNWLLSFIKEYAHGEILEVGCGIGTFSKMLSKYGEVCGVDIDSSYVRMAQKNIPKGKFGLGDIEKDTYFFKNKKFDTLVNLNVLEHIKYDDKALANMYELLKPSGNLVLLTPAHSFAYTPIDKNLGHYRRYSKKELIQKFEKSGFKVLEARYLNMLGLLGWYFSGKILKNDMIQESQLGLFEAISKPILSVERRFTAPFGLSVFVVGEKA